MSSDFFTSIDQFPNATALERYSRLVGLDAMKDRLEKEAEAMLRPDLLEDWSQKFHGKQLAVLELMEIRPPLFVFAGDVGTGKSELAMTFGDNLARQSKMPVQLFNLSLRTRGGGVVGEMSKLITEAFAEIVLAGKKLKSGQSEKARGSLILLIDEADALAQSRASSQMHHEDRAGVNALIKGIDLVANSDIPCLIVMCSNRLDAIDPAVLRRSVVTFEFQRPSEELCDQTLSNYLSDTGMDEKDIKRLAVSVADQKSRGYSYSFSDITQRLLPTLILAAYPDKKIDAELAMKIVKMTEPTPPFRVEE